eukprot:9927667-Karenia_brevis.AAC.1
MGPKFTTNVSKTKPLVEEGMVGSDILKCKFKSRAGSVCYKRQHAVPKFDSAKFEGQARSGRQHIAIRGAGTVAKYEDSNYTGKTFGAADTGSSKISRKKAVQPGESQGS